MKNQILIQILYVSQQDYQCSHRAPQRRLYYFQYRCRIQLSVSLIWCSLASAGSHHYFSQCFKVLEDLLHRSTVSWDSSVQAPNLAHHLLSRSTRRSMLTVLKQYHKSQPESGQAVSLFLSSGQDSLHVVTLVCLKHIVAKFYFIFYPTARIGRVPVLLYNNVQLAQIMYS